MTHLTEIEVVDLLEGHLDAERRRHAEACAACREQARALGAALAFAREDRVPEPSPTFWEHLSARVAHAIRAEPAPSGWTRLFAPWPLRLTTAAVLLLAAGIAWQAYSTRERPMPVAQNPPAEQAPADAQTALEPDMFVDAWDALEAVAQDLEWEEAQAIGIAPLGSAERGIDDLNAAERAELARLIDEELKRHGA